MKRVSRRILAWTAPALVTLATLSACASNLPYPTGLMNPMNPMMQAPGAAPVMLGAQSQPIRPIRTNLPEAKGQRGATMFSYIAMDDRLSQFGLLFLDAMERGASNAGYYLAFADLQGPDSSFLSYVSNDGQPGKINSPLSYLDKNVSEVDSNDPETLAQTLNWAYSNYPGQLKVFDILAHGGGYFGLATDDTKVSKDPREIMSVSAFGYALHKGLKGRQLDVMNFLSCLMGNVEAVYELRDVAKVVIASEDSIAATKDTTYEFTTQLSKLATSGMSPQQIGQQMVAFAQAKLAETGYSTIAALDMRYIADFKRSMNVLSNTLIGALPTHKAQILAAYDHVPELHSSPGTGQRDLIAFLNNLVQGVDHPGVRQAALDVKYVLKNEFIIKAKDKEGPDANGLSIFMPPSRVGNTNMPPDFGKIKNIGYLDTRFAKDTSWDRFIQLLLQP